MLKIITAVYVVMSLLLSAIASAYSILWASTSKYTELVKDEEYAPESMMDEPGVDESTSTQEEETDGDLVFLYEEPEPPELDEAEEKPALPELGGEDEELTLPEPVNLEKEPASPESGGEEEEITLPEPTSVEDEKTEVIDFIDEDEVEEPIHDEIQIP